MIVDSHCHLYDEKLISLLPEILTNLQKDAQIAICSGDNIENSKKCIELANSNKNIYATVGVHPHEAKNWNENSLQTILELSKHKKVVAIGEIGLDYFYNLSPKEIQKKVLTEQIILASKLNLPCVFHVREATADFLEIIKTLVQNYNFKGYVHSFSGSIETAQIYLKYGFYIGVNGIVTFKNANKMLDVVKFLPLDKILIETDSPYLTPVPYRGRQNCPEYVKIIAQKVADLKEMPVEKVIEITTNNAKNLFNIN